MRRLWKAFLEGPEVWWSRNELGETTKLGVGSFEAELIELDMAGLVESQKRFGGQYVRRLTKKGERVLPEGNPDTYEWQHPSWKKAAPDLLEGQEKALRELTQLLLILVISFGLIAVSTSGTLNSVLGTLEGTWVFLAGLVYWWRFKLSERMGNTNTIYRTLSAVTTIGGLFLLTLSVGSWI